MVRFNTGAGAAVLLALALAGCQSARMGGVETPPPLNPAPKGQVESQPLPPPAAPENKFPEPPQGAEVASLPPSQPPANAPDVTVGSVAGVWSVTIAGQSCRVATPQTKYGSGYRAGPLKCPAPIDGVKSWNVAGKQLTLYDETGSALARLYSSGSGRFDGQTSGGQPISLTR